VLLIGQGVGEITAASNTESQTQQSTSGPQQAVTLSVAEWLSYLNNGSTYSLASLYAPQANLTWGGTVGIFGGGTYSGQDTIRLLFSALLENTTLFIADPSPVNTTIVAPDTVNATFSLQLNAERGTAGTYAFEVSVEQEWVDDGGAWQIQRENWIDNSYDFDAVTSTTTAMMFLGPQWSTTPYPEPDGLPTGVYDQSCATALDFLYCVGGAFAGSDSFYSQLGSGGGAGQWLSGTPYPIQIQQESCVADDTSVNSASILCIGGINPQDSQGPPTNQTFIAPLSSTGGIGKWQSDGSYPIPISDASCPTDYGVDGYPPPAQVVCVGGADGNSTSVYWSGLVAGWFPTTPLPSASGHTCWISQLYIYCLTNPTGESTTDDVFYARLSNGGIAGGWNATSPYPVAATDVNCVTNGGYNDYVFCVGGDDSGDVFYARLSHTGGGIIGTWQRATSAPSGFGYDTCVQALSSIWCAEGGTIYYDQILGTDALTAIQTITLQSAIATVTHTTTTTTVSTSFTSQVTKVSALPEIYGLFGIAVIFAASTVFFATKRRAP
jgi:hypothetical protein